MLNVPFSSLTMMRIPSRCSASRKWNSQPGHELRSSICHDCNSETTTNMRQTLPRVAATGILLPAEPHAREFKKLPSIRAELWALDLQHPNAVHLTLGWTA